MFLFFNFNPSCYLVFESINPLDCWDGTYRNEQVPLGTYYYFKLKTNCGDLFK